MKWLRYSFLAVIIALVAIDIALRLIGAGDFPLYHTDPEIGYVINPNQHGIFLNRNHWEFNSYGMGEGPFHADGKRNVLIIGDSIVLGGNPLDQSVRLAPTLERDLGPGWAVWSSAAQGWSSLNKEAWLKRNPKIVSQMETLVWVMKRTDFQGLAPWESNLFNPLHHPLWLAGYLFEKQFWVFRIAPHLPPSLHLSPPEAFPGVPLDAKIPEIETFLLDLKEKNPDLHIVIVWYPEVAELTPPPLDFYCATSKRWHDFADHSGFSFVDMAKEPTWNSTHYRDQIHPNATGDEIFAKILDPLIAPSSR